MPPNSSNSQTQGDSLKFRVGCLSTLLGFFIPLFLLFPLWFDSGWKTALTVCVITFGVLQTIAIISFALIRNLSWIGVATPFLLGVLYSLMPDLLIIPVDHTVVLAAGALFSYYLALRKIPGVPWWVLASMLGAAVYTLIGEIIPTPVDELLVGLISFAVASFGIAQAAMKNLQVHVDTFMKENVSRQNRPPGDIIDVEAHDVSDKPKDSIE